MPNDTPAYLATVKIQRLTNSAERIETTIRGKSIEDVKRKIVGIVNLMEEGDL